MSISALHWVFKLRLENSGAKFILVALANYADEKGYCWPSIRAIGEITGLKERAILVHLETLENLKLLKRGKRRKDDGEFRSNEYFLNLPQIMRLADSADGRSADSADGRSADFAENPALRSADSAANPPEERREPLIGEPLEDSMANQVKEVFEYWKTTLNHPLSSLTSDRASKIRGRLKEKEFNVARLKQAIDGCKASPHHMGKNEEKKVHDSIDLIFRNAGTTERFIGYLKPGASANGFHDVKEGEFYRGRGFSH